MQNYAKKDVYAEVDEEGGKVNRLVAVAGQPIPAIYDELVADSDKSQTPPDDLALTRARQRTGGVAADPELGYGSTSTAASESDSGGSRKRTSGGKS